MVSFNQRLIDRAKDINSFLCVGIDISPEKLGSENIDDLIAHSKLVVDATRDMALAFKPNFAFFERWGPKGFLWLEELVHYIGKGPILIADAKRGDGTDLWQCAEQERAVCQKPSAADLGGTDHAGRAGRGTVAVDGAQPA